MGELFDSFRNLISFLLLSARFSALVFGCFSNVFHMLEPAEFSLDIADSCIEYES